MADTPEALRSGGGPSTPDQGPSSDRMPVVPDRYNEVPIRLRNGQVITVVDSLDDPYDDLRGVWVIMPGLDNWALQRWGPGGEGGDNKDDTMALIKFRG